jgi:hypothetical protein
VTAITAPCRGISSPARWPCAPDLIAEIGENLPDTWEDVHRIGKKLKAKGRPVGFPLSHGAAANGSMRAIIWSWGGKLVEDGSKTVAINSKETVEALKFIKALYQDCMEEEVLAWDDRNNNVCLNSGRCSMILNPISAYNSARQDNAMIPGTERPIHTVINHIMPPKGPAGRHRHLEMVAGARARQGIFRVALREGAAGEVPHRQPWIQPAVPEGILHAPYLRLQSQVLLRALYVELCSCDRLARRTNGGGANRGGSVHHSRRRSGTRDGPDGGRAGSEKGRDADQENLPPARQEGMTEAVKHK